MSKVKKKQAGEKTVEIRQVNDIMFQLWVNGVMILQSMDYDVILKKYNEIN